MPHTIIIIHRGEPAIVQSLAIKHLVQLAAQTDSLVEVLVAPGDAVFDSTPLLRVHGHRSQSQESLRRAIILDTERTFEQDPKYAIRLLVDIAIRALSTAVNDPTTAVEALNHIEDLLIRLGRCRLEIGDFHDKGGHFRLLTIFPTWEDFLRLALDEIRLYGAGSIQVMRRMKALLCDLLSLLPEERRPAVLEWQARLQTTVDRAFPRCTG